MNVIHTSDRFSMWWCAGLVEVVVGFGNMVVAFPRGVADGKGHVCHTTRISPVRRLLLLGQQQ